MKTKTYFLCFFIAFTISSLHAVEFDTYFIPQTMRIDYYHTGDSASEYFALDKLYRDGDWAGVRKNLLSAPDLGRYRATVYDEASGQMIYLTSFDNYFGEYRTTEPAKSGVLKTFHETVLIPYPKAQITLVIEKRDKQNMLHEVFRVKIDPDDTNIIRNHKIKADQLFPVIQSGPVEKKVDIIFISEGYSEKELLKFENDLKRFVDVFYAWEPYASHKEQFNITGIFVASPESGVDEPRKNIYRNTNLDLSFNALGTERYLLTESNAKMRDIAAQVAYDAIFIMANSERYGGSGIFNQFCVFTSNAPWNEYLLHHEFGHSFAGLGDEYFDGSVAYEEFYAPGVEPLAPNITALLDPAHVKWQDLLSPELEIPTPWGKETYDSLTTDLSKIYQQKNDTLNSLRENSADKETIDRISGEFDQLSKATYERINNFYKEHPLRGKVGVFEGAGYSAQGLYRPTVNSIMHRFSESDKYFYPVNERGIKNMILYYCD